MLPTELVDKIVENALTPTLHKEVRRFQVEFHTSTGLMHPAFVTRTTKGGWPLKSIERKKRDTESSDDEDEMDIDQLIKEFTRISKSAEWKILRVEREKHSTEIDVADHGEMHHCYSDWVYFVRV